LYTLVSYKPRTKRDAPWHLQASLHAMAHLFWYEATASMSGAGGGANSVGDSAAANNVFSSFLPLALHFLVVLRYY